MTAAQAGEAAPETTAYGFAIAGVARLAASCPTLDDGLRQALAARALPFGDDGRRLLEAFCAYARRPARADAPLFTAARAFDLSPTETLAVRLAVAAEEDALAGHLIAHAQLPAVQSRPTVGFLAQAYGEDRGRSAVHAIAHGNAVRSGFLLLSADDVPLPERSVRVPLANALALQGLESRWPGTKVTPPGHAPLPLGRTAEAEAETFAARLRGRGRGDGALVIRAGDGPEGRAGAERVCAHLDARAAIVSSADTGAMAPWLLLGGYIPVFHDWLAPGERKIVPDVPGYAGPIVVVTGPDGDFESDERLVLEWRIAVPPPREREELWAAHACDEGTARRLAREHRHTAGRIATLAARAGEVRHSAPLRFDDVAAVARRGESLGLGAFAEVIADAVDLDALVVPADLRDELESLVVRCRMREHFASALGPSIRARYRPSVRALFVGASGTGKTLAAAWLATRLGIPLCRVDLSAVTSKYIGETEKNLGRLLSRAEQNEVVLLFDEADSLFGKRTDINDSNDRFANAQTNYLLQRMESYDGITVLTSNGRNRFDAAFARRFDAILTFPAPGAEERRALWTAHLGEAHAIEPAQLNVVAAIAELSGGQIRNAVLCGAVSAAKEGGVLAYGHVLAGVSAEYRKLGRQLPSELKLAGDAAPV